MILIYALPREVDAYRVIARRLGRPATTISDIKGVGDIWVMPRIYEAMTIPAIEGSLHDLPADAVMAQIVYRCRFLRSLPMEVARRLVLSGFKVLTEIVDRAAPTLVLARPVDYYLNDIFFRIICARAIPYVSPCESQVPGMSLLTARGEAIPARHVEESEVEDTLASFRKPGHHATYFFNYSRSLGHHAKMIAEHLLRDGRRFALKTIERDPLNFHYNQAKFNSTPRHLWDFPRDNLPRTLPNREEGRTRLFVPLAWTPEMSTDYWCPGWEPIGYNDFILALAEKLAADFQVIVKDHVNMVGLRPGRLTKRLSALRNVHIIDPRVPATALMDACDALLVGTGTPGLQAIARGKPVIRFGNVYWATPENSLFLTARTLLRAPNHAIENVLSKHAAGLGVADARSAIKRLLSTSIPGHIMYRRLSATALEAEVDKALPYIIDIMEQRVHLPSPQLPEDHTMADALTDGEAAGAAKATRTGPLSSAPLQRRHQRTLKSGTSGSHFSF